jgi:hypothetical protein
MSAVYTLDYRVLVLIQPKVNKKKDSRFPKSGIINPLLRYCGEQPQNVLSFDSLTACILRCLVTHNEDWTKVE